MCPMRNMALECAAHAHGYLSPVIIQRNDSDTREYIFNASRNP